MPRSSFRMVRCFHEAAGHPAPRSPEDLPAERLALRLTLLGEEVGELVGAMVGYDDLGVERIRHHLVMLFHGFTRDAQPASREKVAKEAIDVHYVTSGVLVEMGIDEDAVYSIVHASNMAKVHGPRRADGKSLKPEGWEPPDLDRVVNP